jgi:uncharacterized coiled-coil DUF342 family protein
MDTVNEEGVDTLASLEQRVQRAVEILGLLRSENQSLSDQLTAVKNERDRAFSELEESRSQLSSSHEQIAKLSEDLTQLRNERKQVKTRIEKLLGQMDLLSAS